MMMDNVHFVHLFVPVILMLCHNVSILLIAKSKKGALIYSLALF